MMSSQQLLAVPHCDIPPHRSFVYVCDARARAQTAVLPAQLARSNLGISNYQVQGRRG